MKKYVCEVCGYVYDPAVGDPEHGVAAGTPFEQLPEDWTCPPCGITKDHFSPLKEHDTATKGLYVCEVCGYVYDPAVGDPEHGIAKGTAFAELPEDWTCPPCGATKEHFSKMKF